MTCETAARFKQILAAILVTLLLRGSLAVKTVLPKVSGDRLQIFRAIRVVRETPEGRHLGAGTKRLRIFQPNRNPFLAELQTHIFQIWSDFFLILLQISGLQIKLVDPRGELTVHYAQLLGMGQ